MPALTHAQSDSSLSAPFMSYAKRTQQAPFGNEVSGAIVNYNRVAPYIANAGLLRGPALKRQKDSDSNLLLICAHRTKMAHWLKNN